MTVGGRKKWATTATATTTTAIATTTTTTATSHFDTFRLLLV